jgi:hypothetical protein
MKRRGTTDPKVKTYQFQSPDILVVPQIPSEVLAIHEFENEGKRVFSGGINPDERYEILVHVAETAAYQHFPV